MGKARFIFLVFLSALLLNNQAKGQDSITYKTVQSIVILGNEITKSHIILREVIFHQGDTLPSKVLDAAILRSRVNLLNTSLFNFVDIESTESSPGVCDIHIIVTERWYWWPIPIFEVVDRNFNEWWQSKDFGRANYGMYFTRYNFRGRQETLKLSLRFGYTENVGLTYDIPYVNKNEKAGLTFSTYVSRSKETDLNTINDKIVYFNSDNTYVKHNFVSRIRYSYRSKIHHTHFFQTEYRNNTILDTIAKLNPEYFGKQKRSEEMINLSYGYRSDFRDSKSYPLKGSLFELDITKQGIGFFKNSPDAMYLSIAYSKYNKLSDRFFVAYNAKARLSSRTKIPYSNVRGLGFGKDFVRGYELYVAYGQNYYLTRLNFRYALLQPKIYHAGFLPMSKFNTIHYALYLSAFSDLGYAEDRQLLNQNTLDNTILAGFGLGLDYVTYYDLVFRIEYSMNRIGDHGLYLHFTAPF